MSEHTQPYPYGNRRAFSFLLLAVLLWSPAVASAQFDPSDLSCNAVTGLTKPLPLCTPESPCVSQLGKQITTPSDTPFCLTLNPNRPFYNDRPVEQWVDSEGTTRYACVFRHPDATSESLRPLVVVLHGGESSADFLYNRTLLRDKAVTFDLTGDPTRPGYHVIAVQGRNIHFPTGLPPFSREGRHHDFYYRDFASPSSNPDIQYYDQLIDNLVSEGIVDPARIYFLGHSNGGFMAQSYVMARNMTSTPGGSVVAGASVYGASDPFNNLTHSTTPSCQLAPYPTSEVPLYLLQRHCDSQHACNVSQHLNFATSPGYLYTNWRIVLNTTIGNPNVEGQLIDSVGLATNACAPMSECTPFRGFWNHIKWPDGRNDVSGIDWEPNLLQFLRENPHP